MKVYLKSLEEVEAIKFAGIFKKFGTQEMITTFKMITLTLIETFFMLNNWSI